MFICEHKPRAQELASPNQKHHLRYQPFKATGIGKYLPKQDKVPLSNAEKRTPMGQVHGRHPGPPAFRAPDQLDGCPCTVFTGTVEEEALIVPPSLIVLRGEP